MNRKIIVLLGKSASGKDTCLNYLKQFGIKPIVSWTTRPKREKETDGVDYFYTTKEIFLDMLKKNMLIDYRKYNTLFDNKPETWYYGIADEILYEEQLQCVCVDIVGYYNLRKYYKPDELLVFYINASDKAREERAKKRGSFSQTEWDRRLKDDDKKFDLATITAISNYVITNENSVSHFYEMINYILKSEKII